MTQPIHELEAQLFKALGHPARIAALEAIRDGERSVGELLPLVGLEQSNLSQQLAVLRRSGIVQSRRVGSSVMYAVVDPRIFQLVEVAKAVLVGALAESRDLLEELRESRVGVVGDVEPDRIEKRPPRFSGR